MHRGTAPHILIGVIELDPDWNHHLDLTPGESPWERLIPWCEDASAASSLEATWESAAPVEVLADTSQLRNDLDHEYTLLIRSRRAR